MSDVRTIDPPETSRTDRAVRRRRGLPGGRAVVGAFLIAVAAVGVFAAYLDATAAPTTRYLVATTDIAPGTRLSAANTAYVAMDLPPEVVRASIPEDLELGAGRESLVLVRRARAGELIGESGVVTDTGLTDRTRMSFAVPSSRALGGSLRPDERIDVLATYDGPEGAYTTVVVRGVRVLSVAAGGDGIGGGTIITVELPDLALAQRLAHAVDAADVFVVRSGSPDEQTPQDYQPEGGVTAPAPADDATQPVPSDAAPQPTEEPEAPLQPADDGTEAP
ncbi:MAG: hypothetical protein ACLGIR_00400 [Actinomycetes bacterium]